MPSERTGGAIGKLDGKVALVTGSSSGIGRSIARGLAAAGAAVVLAARRSDRLRELADEIGAAGGTAVTVATDLTQEAEVEQLFATIKQRFGRLDILVNNATKSELTARALSNEPLMETDDLAQAGILMATMPPNVNVFQATVLPVDQVYVGRG